MKQFEKILVTGADGFIGSHLVEELVYRGNNVKAFVQYNSFNSWEAYYDNGRERTGIDAIEWAGRVCSLGAGEILLTSVDQDGTGNGFDIDLVKKVSEKVDVPVIANGGMGSIDDFIEVVEIGKADAVAIAKVLHYNTYTVSQIKEIAYKHCINVRGL